MRLLALCAASACLLLVAPALAQTAAPLLTPSWGGDAPAAGEPVASIVTHENNLYVWTGGTRWADVTTPDVDWNRVVLTIHAYPNGVFGDPWDRLISIYVNDAEVHRSTSIRSDQTMTEDITEYAALMADDFRVGVNTASYAEAGIFVDARLDFYDDPANGALADPAADRVETPFHRTGLNGVGPVRTTTYDFGATAPESGTIEFFTSGHAAQGEFWWQYDPITWPAFDIYVDGTLVGHVEALPYIYALLGFCCGTESFLINQALWTAPFLVGEHTEFQFVTGEIPAYRAAVAPEHLGLLTGERTVTLERTTHSGNWPSGLNFLLD